MRKEHTEALNQLAGAADLAGMVEEMLSSPAISALSLPGIKLTLKNIRESILASQAVLSVPTAAEESGSGNVRKTESVCGRDDPQVRSTRTERVRPVVRSGSLAGNHAITVVRRELKASVEKMLKH